MSRSTKNSEINGRIGDTMVARKSSVQLVARSILSQFLPLLKHTCREVKKLAGVAPEMYLRECTLHLPLQK